MFTKIPIVIVETFVNSTDINKFENHNIYQKGLTILTEEGSGERGGEWIFFKT